MAIDGAYASYLSDAEKEDGVSLALSPCRSESLRSHAILASPKEAFEGTVHSLNRPAGDHRHLYGANERFRHVFLQWSLLELVRTYDQRINEVRDRAADLFQSVFGVRALRQVQKLTAGLADSALIARELIAYADQGWHSIGGGYVFVGRRFRPREEKTELAADVRRRLTTRARGLSAATGELTDYLSSQANLASARANLWIQIVVSIFAIASLIFGGVSAYEAAMNLREEAVAPASDERGLAPRRPAEGLAPVGPG